MLVGINFETAKIIMNPNERPESDEETRGVLTLRQMGQRSARNKQNEQLRPASTQRERALLRCSSKT